MKIIAVILLILSIARPSRAQEITVAAAADLRPALEELAAKFEASSGVHVKLTYGSSGNFFQQIQNGAPFDIFFSANTDYARKLESSGLTVPGTYYEYARGKIVIMVPSQSALDLQAGLRTLLGPGVKKIAIADPAHAPYGQAAVAALKSQGIYDQVSPKLVVGENISQAASFVLSGAADAGIIALSLALSPSAKSQVRYAEIPADSYPPIQQACIVIKSSKMVEQARQFQTFIQSAESSKIFERYGFEVPRNHQKALQ